MTPLSTPRLILRNFNEDDAPSLLAYLHQPTASCFFSLALGDLQAARDEAHKRGQSDEYLAVCLRETGELIGDLFAHPEEDTYSVGWHINPAYGGKGYAFEAAHALFDYLFESGIARRLYAYLEDTNLPSRRLCEKLHMRQEGLFREFVTFQNDAQGQPIYENTYQYALLRKEWQALRAAVANQ